MEKITLFNIRKHFCIVKGVEENQIKAANPSRRRLENYATLHPEWRKN
jgi:hypothetical protein